MNIYRREVRRALMRAGLVRRDTAFLTSFAIGAGVGIMAGAALALLYAPRSGPEMRRHLGSHAKRLAERTSGALDDVKRSVKGKMRERSEAGLEGDYRAP